MKQSSIEWLFGQFLLYPLPKDKTELFNGDWVDIFEQAKAMHKEEILGSWGNGWANGDLDANRYEDTADKYYDETFGSAK